MRKGKMLKVLAFERRLMILKREKEL